jgi:hypothetical protein
MILRFSPQVKLGSTEGDRRVRQHLADEAIERAWRDRVQANVMCRSFGKVLQLRKKA